MAKQTGNQFRKVSKKVAVGKRTVYKKVPSQTNATFLKTGATIPRAATGMTGR